MKKIDLEPDKYYKEFSSLLQEYIHSYYEVTLAILNKDLYITEPKRFFYTLIHKTNCSLEAANVFICNFEKKRNLHVPLFIILRSILADIIVAEYVIITAKSDDEKAKLIEQIYFDHIENVVTTTEKTFSQMHGWNTDEKEKIILQLKLEKYYDRDGKPKLKSISTTPNTLIRKIFSQSGNKNNELLIRAFDLYSIFSKFEHFGELSFKMTHRGYDQNQISTLTKDLDDCICIILMAQNNYMRCWDEDFEINYDYFRDLKNKLFEMYNQA